ncbi:MAG: rhodanese-like domain-containing protein [Gammaproteobacteria bacterium]|nr:rhodanese-like domain-containing protein [Gammaproteobacteria bacterium]MBU1653351.1 rhodanese-like domain-containing protein [Gammaproteobacteria bacterium]MBU1962778.1 rhodanese-like domain-containing protein [Gammaproteobacteria bacterium]
MKPRSVATTSALALAVAVSGSAFADKLAVGITADMKQVEVTHNGKKAVILRNQNEKNTVNPMFAKTSRKCPPFCVQPATLAPGVETIGELEVLNHLSKMAQGDTSILVVDSRTPEWVEKGTIPGAKNIPWIDLNPAKGASTDNIIKIMDSDFNVKLGVGKDAFDVEEAMATGTAASALDFSNAKTLVMFCNGIWCGQSSSNIKTLLKFGYPADKIKWYRGGMQDWEILGLTTTANMK